MFATLRQVLAIQLLIVASLAACCAGTARAVESAPAPISWNTQAPYCYRIGAERKWPILKRKLSGSESIWLTAKREEEVLGEGTELSAC